jgi:hypothetical protein
VARANTVCSTSLRFWLGGVVLFRARPITELFMPGGGATVTIAFNYHVALDTVQRRQLGYDLFGSTGSDDAWYPTLPALPDSLRRFSSFDVVLEAPRGVAVLTSGMTLDSTRGKTTTRRRDQGDG